MFLDEDFYDLIKSASFHKYVKRTGGPGNYKYWYKLPDGRLVSSDDPAASEHGISPDKAKREHLLRLILSREAGHHSMSSSQMADHVGISRETARQAFSNHTTRSRRGGSEAVRSRFEDHEIKEAHHANPEDAPRSPREASSERLSVEEFLRRNTRDFRLILRQDGFRPVHDRDDETIRPDDIWQREHSDGSSQTISMRDGQWILTSTAPGVGFTHQGTYHRTKIEDAIRDANRIAGTSRTSTPESAPAPEPTPAPAPAAPRARRPRTPRAPRETAPAPTPEPSASPLRSVELTPSRAPAEAPSAPAQTPEQAEIERLRSALRELDPALHESLYGSASTSPEVVSQSQQRAREAKQRAQAAASPSSPEAAELHEADPSLRAADEAIARMEEAQRRGENPYFTRAKEIYNNIRGDLKPERREKIGHILSAIEQIRQSGSALTEQSIVAKYNEITGRRTREFPHDDFEPSTYMTLDEVIANAPLDVEVERMKRGYAAKQFTRLRPYLKDAWVRSNPSAPPPMPTFGDIKSWGEHGGPKPEWAGNTRLAMPREVFDAAVKGADGKVKYPPAWMPLHLMPAWNYIVKKAESAGKLDSEYRGRSPIVADQSTPTGWNIDAGTTAGTADGIAMNALRKYVKMRGGAEQLTDIPKTKLAEMGLSHAEIFKADADSDEGLKQVIRHKIVDPVALLPFIKEEMKSLGVSKSVKQTFSLVVDKSLAAVTFKKENELKKSQLIKKIRALKAKRS